MANPNKALTPVTASTDKVETDATDRLTEPSYKLSEGTRNELEVRGHAISPFTGALLVGTPDNVREVTEAEYLKVAKEAAKKEAEKPNKGTRFAKSAEKQAEKD